MDYCMHCMKPHSGSGPCPHCSRMAESAPAAHLLRPGTLLGGRYLLGRAIGQGGFGITYIGRDLTLDLRVAVKEFFPFGFASREADGSVAVIEQERADFVRTGAQRFLREARILARFSTESGVVNVRDCFEANNTAYLVMEYLEGADLRKVLQERLFTPDEIFEKMTPLMDALEKIHAEGVIHRDISPDNIMLLPDGTLKLMDFGAARPSAAGAERSQAVMLKRGYAPPEQYIEGDGDGPWTDIYALCATIYKCITGITPEDSLLRAKADPTVWPSAMDISIRTAQENAIKKGMEPDAAHRFRSIGALKRQLALSADDDITVYLPKAPAKKEDSAASAPARNDSKPKADGLQKAASPAAASAYGAQNAGALSAKQTLSPAAASIGGAQNTGAPSAKQTLSPAEEPKPTKEESEVSGGSMPAHGPHEPVPPVRGRAPLPHRLLIFAAALCVLAVLGAAALVLSRMPGIFPASSTQTEQDDFVYFTLTAQDMSVSAYQQGLEIVRQRLNILAGEDGYRLSEKDGSVRLGVAQEVFGDLPPVNILKCYVTRPVQIYLIEFSDGTSWNPQRAALDRADLESVVLRSGNVPGAEDAQAGQYIELTLTEQAAQRIAGDLSGWNQICYAQDVDMNTYMYMDCVPAADGRTFYLVNSDTDPRYNQTLLYNLTHAPLAEAFGVQADLRAVWEDPSAAAVPGKNQVSAGEITGECVTMFYTTYTDDVTAGEWLDTQISMKARLDSVGTPYAFGTPEGSEFGIAVRIGTERMSRGLMQYLGQDNPFSVRAGLGYCSTYSASFAAENGALLYTPAEYQIEDLKAMVKDALADGQTLLTLSAGQMPLLQTELRPLPEDGSIRFDALSTFDGADASEQPWLAEMICAYSQNQLPNSYYLEQHRFSSEEAAFGVHYGQMHAEFEQAVHSVCPGVLVHFSEDETTAYVHLDLNVDETMVPEAAEKARAIFEAVSFPDTNLSTLILYMTEDEDDMLKERSRIIFNRIAGLYGYDETGYVCASGIMLNGRMDRYKDDLAAIVSTDEFYLSLADPNGIYTWRFDE